MTTKQPFDQAQGPPDRLDRIEGILEKLTQQLTDFRNDTRHRLDTIDTKLQLHGEILGRVEKRLDTLDSRLYDFSMRIVTTNQSAFWGVSIALLSAAIAFVVSRISGGNP